MLRVESEVPMDAVEGALRRAAHRHGSSVLAVTHLGHVLRDREPAADALVFTMCQQELYSALLAAEVRMAALLPCRIAACLEGARTTLESISPVEFCRLLNRPDLAPLAAPLESAILAIMQDAARPSSAAAHAAQGARRGTLGATEEQMNMRGSLPQRIDCHGTKVEELGGTGQHDSQGG